MTSTSLARVQQIPGSVELLDSSPAVNRWIELLAPAAELARSIAETDFVPKEMRNRPASITACILYGAEIGIGPMQALAKVDIINGRPAPRAELGRALALGAGHEIWVEESTNTRVKVSGRRRGSDKVQTTCWTMDDVKKAGISNSNYAKYPRQMLLARASAELVRMMCPDVLGGVTVFAEEAADIDATEPATTDDASTPVKATTRKRATAVQPSADAQEPPPLPDDIPQTGDGPTDLQIKKMMATFNDLGIKDRGDRLSFIATAIRTVESSKDLSVEEAGTVIDALERVVSGELDMVWAKDGIELYAKGSIQKETPPPPLDDEEPF